MSLLSLTPHHSLPASESNMPDSPTVTLANGHIATPQHYLQFHQTLTSVSALLADIECLDLMPLFASEDDKGLYLQVGMVGRENYDRSNSIRPQKLVYGRKWRIESDTPTSEVIQTAFLAIQKACEHEVRELFTLKDKASGKTSTPFSTHHDLPLMADNPELITTISDHRHYTGADLMQVCDQIQFEQRKIIIDHLWVHPTKPTHVLADIRLGQAPLARQQEQDILDFEGLEISLALTSYNPAHFLHALMNAFIYHTQKMIAERFCYRGFSRFSENNDPRDIAALSIASRPYARDMKDPVFADTFNQLNYSTDASRAPHIGEGALAEKNRHIIKGLKGLTGHMPKGL